MQRRILLIIFLLTVLTSCAPSQLPSAASPWQYAHLRALDPADAPSPASDLIAIYTRRTTQDIQVRLDVLNLPTEPEADFYLALDLVPGGTVEMPINAVTSRSWDLIIVIPSEGRPSLSTTQSPISNIQTFNLPIPRVIRDPALDTIIISLNAHLLPKQAGPFYIQAFTTAPGSPVVLDSLESTLSEALPPGRAPLLVSFWNALPAHTPAQTLRRWDGAHTGPLGRRHGLKHLVEATEHHQVPITLLDLKTPISLSALEILGATSQFLTLSANGTIILPDTLPATYFGELPTWVDQEAAAISREIAINLGLHGSALLFVHDQQPNQFLPYTLSLILQSTVEEGAIPQTYIYQNGDQTILPIPLRDYDTVQITEEGLDLEIKKALLAAAIEAGSSSLTPITVLGGDLPHTNWGDPLIVDLAMRYLATHPWIQPLSEADLLTYRRIPGYKHPIQSPVSQQHETVLAALEEAPQSPINNLAWDAYLALLAPADPAYPELPKLRSQYLGIIGDLLTAARWDAGNLAMRKSESLIDCSIDTDFDGQPECILASEDIFALINPQGARLSLLFIQDEDGAHQIVGQSSQFSVGLSNPSTWDFSLGPLSDPQVIPGAFAGPWEPFEVTQLPDRLRFTSATVLKDFILTGSGLRVEYQSNSPIQVQIPLVIAPETRFSSGWDNQYFGEDTTQGWIWGIETGPRVLMQTSGVLTTQTFADDLPALLVPEDPNYDYAPGHFFPFPLAVAQITSQGDFWVQLEVLR